jgi:hypothetical protein
MSQHGGIPPVTRQSALYLCAISTGVKDSQVGREEPKAAREPQGRSDDVGEQDGLAVLVCLMSVQHDTSSSQKRFQ